MSRHDDDGLDYRERDGFLSGKAAALADWQHKKEKRSFEKLIASLRASKWNKEHPERRKANASKYWREHRDVENEKHRQRDRRAPRERVCDVCRKRFALPYPHPRGSVPKRCSDECSRLARNRQARKDGARQRRDVGRKVTACTVCRSPGHNARTCPTKGAP